jgi:SAM-dependent methyltransferase
LSDLLECGLVDSESGPNAENWVRWARTPNHDAYWYYRDAFFDDLVPRPGRLTIEIGCGEGRVTRDLTDRGHRVVAIDLSRALIDYAHDADPLASCVVADGSRLPFHDGCVDLAVSYNSLQAVDDLAGPVREVARVLERHGHFCVCVIHPVTHPGRFLSGEPDATFAIPASYFERKRVETTATRDGLTFTFRYRSHALEDYFRAFSDAGLRVEAIREPRPKSPSLSYERFDRVPMFLNLLLLKM